MSLEDFFLKIQTCAGDIEIDSTIRFDYVRQWIVENVRRKKQVAGPNSGVANGPHHEYRLDFICIHHLEDQTYDTALV